MNKIIPIVLITLIVGLGGGYFIATTTTNDAKTAAESGERTVLFWRNPMNPDITSPVATKDSMGMDYVPVYAEEEKPKKEREVLFWRNPMNPDITSPVPTKDSMGMDYVPVYADADQADDEPAGTVKIDATTVQNIGVRTATVHKQSLSRIIRAVGRVGYDEQRLTKLHPKVEGWVEKLHVEKTGEKVEKNTVLLSVYSPQLVATQQEYLLALKNIEALKGSKYPDIRRGAQEMLDSARERLTLLDVPEHQILELEISKKIKKDLHIHSPFSGIVVRLGVRKGQYITPKDELYMLADLNKVWVYVDIYEDEMPWVNVNDEANMTVTGVPGRIFKGLVTYIYPYLERKTRTVKVRLEFDNRDGALKPDMFAEVDLFADRQADTLVVPTEAVVRSGSRNQVFVVRAKGKFEPRIVKLGVNANGMTQILTGLKENETVVTSSQFLIDSESKLREATAKMMAPKKDLSADAQKDSTETPKDPAMNMPETGVATSDINDMDMSDMTIESLDAAKAKGENKTHDPLMQQ